MPLPVFKSIFLIYNNILKMLYEKIRYKEIPIFTSKSSMGINIIFAMQILLINAHTGGGNSPDFIQIPCWAWI
jgi:hypothetical protein